jgi:hypothetical protein
MQRPQRRSNVSSMTKSMPYHSLSLAGLGLCLVSVRCVFSCRLGLTRKWCSRPPPYVRQTFVLTHAGNSSTLFATHHAGSGVGLPHWCGSRRREHRCRTPISPRPSSLISSRHRPSAPGACSGGYDSPVSHPSSRGGTSLRSLPCLRRRRHERAHRNRGGVWRATRRLVASGLAVQERTRHDPPTPSIRATLARIYRGTSGDSLPQPLYPRGQS